MEIKVELSFDREAKNTVRYFEKTNPPKLWGGTVYIQKSVFEGDDYPPELELTIVTPKAKLAAIK